MYDIVFDHLLQDLVSDSIYYHYFKLEYNEVDVNKNSNY
jgi:hypothetical protein